MGRRSRSLRASWRQRVQDICARLKAGSTRPRRCGGSRFPKGRARAERGRSGIPTVEDRLLQRAVARILECRLRSGFSGVLLWISAAAQPASGAAGAARATIVTGKVRQVYEADIRGYFNHINHQWLRRMVAQRIADPVILSLIGKWLKAGVMEDGSSSRTGRGNPARRPDQPVPRQCLSALRARPVVREAVQDDGARARPT